MKKIMLKTIVALMALSFIVVSCQPEVVELNNPDRPSVAPAPTITGDAVNNPPLTDVTLSVAVDAPSPVISWVWHRSNNNGVSWFVLDTLDAEITTFVVRAPEDGIYPYGGLFRAAAITISGIGLFSPGHRVDLIPPYAPSSTTISGEDNVCPIPFIELRAVAEFAVEYRWYRNGVLLPGKTTATIRVRESGTYTAVGFNLTGESPLSNAVTVTWVECEPFEVEGEWSATGEDPIWPQFSGGRIDWVQKIVPEGDTSTTVFILEDWARLGQEWSAGPPFNLRVHRDAEGLWYIPHGVPSGRAGFTQVVAITNPAGVPQAFLPGGIYLELSQDYDWFRTPPTVTIGGNTFRVGFGVAQTGVSELLLDQVFTLDESTSSMPTNIEWIPNPRNNNLQIGEAATVERSAARRR